MAFRQLVSDTLSERRKMSAGTLKTYTSLLVTIVKKNNFPEELATYDTQVEKILDYIADKDKAQSRKTALSGLFVLTGNDKYKSQMLLDIAIVNEHYKTRVISKDRLEKFKTPAELKTMNDSLIATYKKVKSGENLNNVVISMLMSGVYLPPRRLEYATVKISDYDKEKDNYIIKNKITLNQYKTQKQYGVQVIELPKEVMLYVNKLVKENTSGYLFQTKKAKPFSPSLFSKRLTDLFGISADLLRSSYINHVLYKDEMLQKLEDGAKAMGNSVDAQMNYYIKDNLN